MRGSITREKEILLPKDETILFDRLKKTKFYNICKFILYTGLRKGEAVALTWEDIDFSKETIKVNKSLDYDNDVTKTTKTQSGIRTIPLFPKALETLQNIGIKQSGLVFEGIDAASLTNSLKYHSEKIGLDLAPHNLRHTFATRCLEAGIEPKVVQEWLGHKSYATTINTYSHTTGIIEKETEKMKTYLNLI
jgi:integrase